MDVITVDFETFYSKDYGLGKMTTQEYILDPRFQEIGIGIKWNDEPTRWVSSPDRDVYRKVFEEYEWSKSAVCAHNTMFDGAILSWHYGIKPKLWLDTLSMARPVFGTTVGGSLAKVSDILGIGAKGTEVVMALGKRWEDFSPSEMNAYAGYCMKDTDLCRKIFKLLRKGGVAPSGITLPMMYKPELLLIDETIRMFTEPMLELDKAILVDHKRNLHVETQEALKSVITQAARGNPEVASMIVSERMKGEKGKSVRQMLSSNPFFAALLTEAGVEPPMKTSPTTGKETFAFAKTDKAFTELQESENPAVRALVSARLKTKTTIEETRTQRFIDMADRGPMPAPLAYCGAYQTWRWSGQDKLNLQNLPRGGVLRRAMRAPKGHKVVVVDSSNIELRVNHTLAGQHSSVDAFKAKRDLYCEFASILFGFEVTKAEKHERTLGKLAHLSLGYGCGAETFRRICRLNGVVLDLEEAERIVKLWRQTYAQIPKLWRQGDKCLEAMMMGSKIRLDEKGLVCTKSETLLTAPHHYIRFPELEKHDGEWSYMNRNQRKKTYGANIVENVCQHLARNIMSDQWLQASAWCRANAPQWRVLLQVHDEILLCGPEQHADAVLAAVTKIMQTSPVWWPEIPLDAEGDIGDCYGDAK